MTDEQKKIWYVLIAIALVVVALDANYKIKTLNKLETCEGYKDIK